MNLTFPSVGRTFVGVLGLLIALAAPTPARADTVFLVGGADFSDSTNNTGGNIAITISDILGGVEIDILNSLLDPGAFISALYLNTTSAPLTSPSLVCTDCADTNNVAPTGSFGSNAFKGGPDGFFDIRLLFDTTEANRLTPGDSITLQILSSTAGFNAASFESLSAPAGGPGPFLAVAHLQSLPPDGEGSDWVTTTPPTVIPEPTTLSLLGMGLVGAALRRRRRTSR